MTRVKKREELMNSPICLKPVLKPVFGSWDRRAPDITHSFENRIHHYFGLPKMCSPEPTIKIHSPELAISVTVSHGSPEVSHGTPYNVMAVMSDLVESSPMFNLELDEAPEADLPSLPPSATMETLRSSDAENDPDPATVESPITVMESSTPRELSNYYPDLPKQNILELLRKNVNSPRQQLEASNKQPIHGKKKRRRHRQQKMNSCSEAYSQFREKYDSPQNLPPAQRQAWEEAEE